MPRKDSLALDLVVFICGAVVMTYEIIGSRILAPFIGTSTYVWTSLIGIILAALSLGYWLGGKLADRYPTPKVLASTIFAAGGLIAFTTLTKEVVLSMIASVDLGLEFKSVIAAVILFAPASVALGFVTPFAVKLRMSTIGDAGKTVGRLYALSTVGSIVGTFTAGFFFIPFVGSVRTLYLLSALLFATSLLLAPFVIGRLNIAALIVFVFGIAGSELSRYALLYANDLHDIDTPYSRVQVFQSNDKRTGKPIRALTFDPYSTQSAMFLDSDDLVFEYTKFYHLLRAIKPGFRHTLLIGGAGFSIPKTYLATYPEALIDVVEIDPGMTVIAREYFRLRDDPRMSIIHRDGRVFLNQAESGKYDAVLMDAFSSLLTVPFQLTTVEAVRNIDRVLKDDGVVIFNMGSAINGRSSQFLQMEFRTYKEVFPNVYVFKVYPERADTELQNLIVVACKTDCLPATPTGDQYIDTLLTCRYLADIPLTLPMLTDDLAPVERFDAF